MGKTTKLSRSFIKKIQSRIDILESLDEQLSSDEHSDVIKVATKLQLWRDETSSIILEYLSFRESQRFERIFDDDSLSFPQLFTLCKIELEALREHALESPEGLRYPNTKKSKSKHNSFDFILNHPIRYLFLLIICIAGITWSIAEATRISGLKERIDFLNEQLTNCENQREKNLH